jgi:Cu-processing system permease protein
MTTFKILKYVLYDVLRSRVIIIYTLLLLLISIGIIYTGKDISKAVVSLLNIVLLIIPLVSIVFGTVHYYNSKEFIEMLLAMPVKRKQIFWAEYAGLALSLSIGFIIGVGVPLLIHGSKTSSIYLLVSGLFLTFIFSGFAMLSFVMNKDKARGIGFALVVWFFTAVIFDSLVLIFYYMFNSYPLEKATIIIAALNPIDLARILILLQMDISALMGYTGAVLQKFFGSAFGKIYSLGFLLLWCIIPALTAKRIFNNKNF